MARDQSPAVSLSRDDTPASSDFLYFSFVIGMTFQVADVAITDKDCGGSRLVQGVLAFSSTSSCWRLTINILAGMI